MTDASALFERDGEELVPHASTRGPWDPGAMHGGVPAALIARAIEEAEPGRELGVVRITVDLLSAVPLEPVTVSAEVIKPGRRFQIVEATLDAGGRTCCRARGVRLRRDPGFGAPDGGPLDPPLPPPEDHAPLATITEQAPDDMFHPAAMEIRPVRGEAGSGAVAAWFRLHSDLEAGVPPSAVARAIAAADFCNGIAWVLPWEQFTFVNTDLTIQLHREPVGEWIGLDARTTVGPEGIGTATGVLHDRSGPVGVAAQSLLLERR